MFSPRYSAKNARGLSSNSAELPLNFLDEVSCFETLRIYGGKAFCFEKHAARLRESCLGIGRELPWDALELQKWVKEGVRESGFGDALLRVSVHWTRAEEGTRCPEGHHVPIELVAIFRPFQSYPAELYENGVSLVTATPRRWTLRAQDPQIKASQFMSGVLAAIDNRDRKAHELVLLNQQSTVAEGTVSNIFIVEAGRPKLLTPSVSSGILRGVTRAFVIDLARKRGFGVTETFLTRHEIYSATECFMTNTSSEILPVASLDGRRIGSGKPGPITKNLIQDFERERNRLLK